MTRLSRTVRGAIVLGVAAASLCALRYAEACTRILWNNNKLAVVVSRTMDWPESTQPVLTIFPRGVKHDGGHLGGAVVVPANPAGAFALRQRRDHGVWDRHRGRAE